MKNFLIALVCIISFCVPCFAGIEQDIVIFFRGDANGDDSITVSDSIFISNYLFQNGPAPVCFDAADFDGSSAVNITDVILILDYLFNGGNGPAAPVEVEC